MDRRGIKIKRGCTKAQEQKKPRLQAQSCYKLKTLMPEDQATKHQAVKACKPPTAQARIYDSTNHIFYL
jgi:hypothetical protein